MPELPEVEVTRRHLDEAMRGRVITGCRTSHPRTARYNSGPDEVDRRLQGRRVVEVGRRGKFLVAPLDDGQVLAAHLGMSGRFSLGRSSDPEPPHTHFRARLDHGVEVRFVDPRTFGFVAVFDEEELPATGLARLGPDALAELPTVDRLAEGLRGRTAPIKALLLDQALISGLGNIYADEVLHRAGVHPLRRGGEMTSPEVERLVAAVERVLADAIQAGGTSLDDLAYLLPDGRAGDNLDRLRVYGRPHQPCPSCGTPVERVTVRARSSHFCPRCQPLVPH